jgi:histidyl-tRNA synthetase
LFSLAELYGIADHLLFDISVIRGLAYYTDIVFEAFDTKRECRAIFGGGRYDNLLTAIGGAPTPAVGLGFGDVVVVDVLKSLLGSDAGTVRTGVAVGFMFPEQRLAAVKLAVRLRNEGHAVDLALAPQKPKSFFARAGGSICSHAVFIGPDDVTAGRAQMKDLTTREAVDCVL